MRRAWLIATETPHLWLLLFLFYYGTKHIVTGTASAPAQLHAAAPPWLVWAWTLSLAIGSAVSMLALVTERTRAESVGLAFCLFGLVFFLIADRADLSGAVPAVLLGLMCASRLTALRRARQSHARVLALLAEGQR